MNGAPDIPDSSIPAVTSGQAYHGALFEANPVDAVSVSRFQILALDGGGIKGLFSAAVLAAIEEDLKIDITEHFDLITGTSTGGIIALGLSLGMRPKEIVEFYVSKGSKLFSRSLYWSWLTKWLWRKYSALPLKQALQECFKDKLLSDCKKRLVIPSFNLGEDDVYLFRTPHAVRLRRDYKVPIWKVALATSAAPTYFPVMKAVDHLRLIDGGVWANNPTLVGIIEALGTLQVPSASLSVLSLGTTNPIIHRGSWLDNGGLLAWARGGAAVDIIMRGQSIAVDNQAAWLLGRERVVRLDPRCPDELFSLDGVDRASDLIGKARHVSRLHMTQMEKCFFGHKAPIYTPCHS